MVKIGDIRDLEDRVSALGTLYFTGRGSGIRTEAPVAIVASFRKGLMTDFKDYGDRDRPSKPSACRSRAPTLAGFDAGPGSLLLSVSSGNDAQKP